MEIIMVYSEITAYMPKSLQPTLKRLFSTFPGIIEEIRFKTNRPLCISAGAAILFVDAEGGITDNIAAAYTVTDTDMTIIFKNICENSVYAYLDEIRKGFITIRGGHRVGFTGRAITSPSGAIENFGDISSINIRVAREIKGSADPMMKHILRDGKILNTLVVSPPQMGKTTVLRDITRQLSTLKYKTAVADDRGEISAMYRGVPQNDLGPLTDVMFNAPKHLAVVMMLRSMSPDVIITDEIATEEDVGALMLAFGSGVSIIASAHGSNKDEILQKPIFKPLFANCVFENIIMLSRKTFSRDGRVVDSFLQFENISL